MDQKPQSKVLVCTSVPAVPVTEKREPFWQPDEKGRDGIIWPSDTFKGFCTLGYGVLLGAEGRFIPQKLKGMCSTYASGKDSLNGWVFCNLLKGQRFIADRIGWGAAMFEWIATHIHLSPEDVEKKKQVFRGIYDEKSLLCHG
ncbi:hypothetical protein EDB81DRAFT_836840 [Dactylonectria macrodidyma]|uniref:Uncharacterized protein n=1 Tax=Dactylonectria macrodidyma TaxID=307937 RepID=A0A9P9FVX1_9HYPO|nr:hypothetical protein EDB81DRAFT_836840 [Dactylonectria macrodidyma]